MSMLDGRMDGISDMFLKFHIPRNDGNSEKFCDCRRYCHQHNPSYPVSGLYLYWLPPLTLYRSLQYSLAGA